MNQKTDIMRNLFRNEHNLKSLRQVGIDPKALRPFEKLSEKKRATLKEMGVDEDEYREFARAYWLVYEAELMESEFQNCCLTLMREQQSFQKENMGDIPDLPCSHQRPTTVCGPLCPGFVKATEEQDLNFTHFCDIDTGKSFPTREIDEDQLGS